MFANEELGSGSVVDGLKTAYFNKVGFFPTTMYCQCCTEIKYMAYGSTIIIVKAKLRDKRIIDYNYL